MAEITMIENHTNNADNTERELSDLYGCKVPMLMKIVNGVQKSKKVDFASLEHAWCMRRMMRNPHVGTSRTIMTVSNMQQEFVTTQEDVLCFLAQFEEEGVFASWPKINVYYAAEQITLGEKGLHNIGLIARFVCSNNPQAEKIREQIRGVAADRWKSRGDTIARSIACCLWRGSTNLSPYKSGLAVVARSKYDNNPEISNILCMTRGRDLLTTFVACRMVTNTRKQTASMYMRTLQGLSMSLKWQLHPALLLALLMAFHRRLGQHSVLSNINMDTFLLITRSLLDSRQEKKVLTFFKKSVGKCSNNAPE